MDRPADTSDEVHRMRMDALRAMPPARRVEIAIEMSELAMHISAAGAKRRRARRESA